MSIIGHKEYHEPFKNKVEAHQLWVQLPPKIEDEPASYIDKSNEEIPLVDEKVKVIAGSYKGTKSQLNILVVQNHP